MLNVGPTGRGELDERALDRLAGIGPWMRRHSRSIYGCAQAPDGFVAPANSRYTHNPDTRTLYLHCFRMAPFGSLRLEGIAGKIRYAQPQTDASEIEFSRSTGDVRLRLPVPASDPDVPVIEQFLR